MTNATPASSQAPTPSPHPNLSRTSSTTTSRVPLNPMPQDTYSAPSPYAIETSDAVGQSPVLTKSRSQQGPQESDTPAGPIPPRNPLISQRMDSRIHRAHNTPFSPGSHSQIETNSSAMMPPPRRFMGNTRMVGYPALPLDFSQDEVTPGFVPDDEFSGAEDNQRSSIWRSWTSAEISGSQGFFCQMCSSTGLVDLGIGPQQCFACNPAFEIET
jgi:hypothetical protein